MALFISLAYIAIALDATGLLRFLAFWVVRKGGSSGHRLYLFLYIFFFVFGVIVGNDPIILSGTAFLAYLTKVAGIAPPTAWIFAQFCACNIASAVLVSSNPTNLVVAGGFEISFLVFTANLVLPVFASAIAVYPVLRWFLFRSEDLIPVSIYAQDLDPKAALVDSHGAIFGSSLMLTTLMVLVGTSAGGLHVEVWMITVPAAIIMFIRDVLHDINSHRRKAEVKSKSNPSSPIEPHHSGGPIPSDVGRLPKKMTTSSWLDSRRKRLVGFPMDQCPKFHTSLRHQNRHYHSSWLDDFLPPSRHSAAALPFASFRLCNVHTCSRSCLNWLDCSFAGWWAAWARAAGLLGVVGGMGFVSVCLCNLCGTNIGATILLARVIQVWIRVMTHHLGLVMEPSMRLPLAPIMAPFPPYSLRPGGPALARHLAPKGHYRETLGICQVESCFDLRLDVGGMQCFSRSDLCSTTDLKIKSDKLVDLVGFEAIYFLF
ncbi:hypothetical protein RhiXN_10485 [Rhizoctonia solani]|uniref:Citrate transporter-like domain-containing protein n=1 Tax=Rhizoctonia solani TaxID=456999 RepID=A0A8H8SZB8_9AGAM|nr:uncharacterized protein RhiXN_10485 [Rhizoctonia solani]QRW24161.1 hypothetical protein RhiXN_10485 [Rhizoctonia solani]